MKPDLNRRTFLTTALVGTLEASAFIPHQLFAFSTVPDFSAIREKIRKEVASGSPASIAVAVAKDGKVVWEEAFGWADVQRRNPATTKTRYAVSSVSKPFTATAVMALVERGLLNIDKPIGKYLDGLGMKSYIGDDVSALTVKHLLQHTSGLPRHWRNFYSDENSSVSTFAETFSRYGIITNTPGAAYGYTNLGYGLLAHIVEKISGKRFANFAAKEVFLPLGLKDTSVENELRLSRPAASLYNADGLQIPYYQVDESGSQRVFSTVSDLIRFGMFHLKNTLPSQKKIINHQAIDRMTREKYPMDGKSLFSSLGWLVLEKGPHNYLQVSHSGDAPGVSAQLMLLPDQNIAVAVLSNTRFAELIYTVTDDVLDHLLPDNKKMRESDRALKTPNSAPFAETSKQLTGSWEGEISTYNGKISVVMTFKPDGDVHFKLDGQMETQVSNLQFADNKLSGRCHGTITTGDATSKPHQLRLALRHENDFLLGTIHAQASIDAQAKGIPKRDYFALASWIRLTRKPLNQ